MVDSSTVQFVYYFIMHKKQKTEFKVRWIPNMKDTKSVTSFMQQKNSYYNQKFSYLNLNVIIFWNLKLGNYKHN